MSSVIDGPAITVCWPSTTTRSKAPQIDEFVMIRLMQIVDVSILDWL